MLDQRTFQVRKTRDDENTDIRIQQYIPRSSSFENINGVNRVCYLLFVQVHVFQAHLESTAEGASFPPP